MTNVILIAVCVLGAIGLIAALVLWGTAKKFAVKEDPRIGQVQEALPGANCGGCGFPGCGGMAAACVKAADHGSLEGLSCPVGGQECMNKVAAILGMEAAVSAPKVAVVRCNGTCENRPRVVEYDGVKNCRIANTTAQGETGCQYGCLGCGDCVAACQFGAIKINPATGLPEVDRTKCTACGACAKACPRTIIEIRQVDEQKQGMVVTCMNKDKGAVANKVCAASCIGCGKCKNVCGAEAITVENNLSYIDAEKCISCRACEEACPKACIIMLGEPRKEIKKPAAPAAKPAASSAAAPAAQNTAPAAKSTNTRPYDKPIEVKFDAPLLPSQQFMLAGTVDLVKGESKSESAEVKDYDFTAPLPVSQQILLGLKTKNA
ncbi:MAG: RnfABCDGE type electron transport complex subunit B [Bacteroidaceae bacterium]|nr:RnfABCDGE type electron transport complex subunit B [Bacteroidaceae bacterium]